MKLGIVTIGQSPRSDVIPEMAEIWGRSVRVVERGALDELSDTQIRRLAPRPGEYVLVTRLREGQEVAVSKQKLLPLLQQCMDEMARMAVDAVLLLCTAPFPSLDYRGMLIRPQEILFSTVTALVEQGTLGVLVPSAAQERQAYERWAEAGLEVVIASASPYCRSDPAHAARRLAQAEPALVVLDCMGYSRRDKEKVQTVVRCPVILARGLIAHVVAAMAG